MHRSAMRLLGVFSALMLLLAGVRSLNAESQHSTLLMPGDNLVGWVGEPIDTNDLFDAVPQSQLVYSWDGEGARFRFSSPHIRGDLYKIEPGMGIVIRIAGSEIVEWSRPVDRPAPMVFLESGWNLVAWSGADGVPISEVASSHKLDDSQVVGPDGATKLNFGDAVWIRTPRAIGWNQVADLPIELIATATASTVVKNALVTEALAAIAWYKQEFGLEIAAHLTFYLHFDCEELQADALPEHDVLGDLGCLGSYHPHAAWAGSDFVVVDLGALYLWGNSWRPHDYFRDVHTHELAHVLQYQLTDRSLTNEPAWLVEGVAMWMTTHRKILAEETTWLSSTWLRQLEYSSQTPTLSSVEDRPDYRYEGRNPHIYWLGLDAAHLLQDMTEPDALFDYWRVLGEQRKSEATGDPSPQAWKLSFQEVFGLAASDFYEQFEDWKLSRADEILWSRMVTRSSLGEC